MCLAAMRASRASRTESRSAPSCWTGAVMCAALAAHMTAVPMGTSESGFESNRHFVCISWMAASVCQLVPDPFVRIPSSERSSAKSPCRQVNESSSPLQPLIIEGKKPNGTQSPPPTPQLFRLCASVNSRCRNTLNGLLRVPVNEKIPALNLI
jgi:hypothetical protein